MKITLHAALGVPLMIAAALALSTGPAAAATGDLAINGTTQTNPSGCYALDGTASIVDNLTDEPAEIHAGPDCTGEVLEVIRAGDDSRVTEAQSLYIP
ncbi:hypothetical protein ABZX88_28395 [Kitasatospora aureofaciens]|uniref:hypothetical protein n=1 Tax=Kitasatospora aureofaciens TaxID=1894 RepID=UPI001D3EE434|nr:hypothetical protein [Kitasatospora aureofaciens]HJD85354.1 hypothetical protein [Kitasatospora aureofaciens]